MENTPHPLASPPWVAGGAKSSAVTRWSLLAKIVVSAALLYYLGIKVEWHTVSERLAAAAPGPLLAAVALLIGSLIAAALRWRLLVQQGGARMSMSRAVQWTYAGQFFGQVLPATVGGDLVRGVLAYRSGLPWRDVLAGVVLDRVAALLGSVILIFSGLPLLAERAAGEDLSLAWTVLVSLALIIGLGVALSLDRLPLPLSLTERPFVANVLGLARRLRHGLRSRAGFVGLALSLLIHLNTVLIVVVIAQGLCVAISPLAAFLVLPLAILAAAVPISLNGWGVREGVMVTGLGLFGVPAGDALLVSVTLGLAVVVSVLPGSFTWLTAK